MTICRKYVVLAIVIGFAVLGGIPQRAAAQIQGIDQIRVIVAFASGGVVDLVSRFVAQGMMEQLGGTPVIVDNRGGAAGDLAVNAVAAAAPDGKTLLFHTSSYVLNAVKNKKVKEIQAALQPLARVGAVKFVIVARRDLPAKTLSDLVKLSKAGTKLSYASTGYGSALHIAGEMLKDATGIQAVHVPYKGLAPAFNDITGNRVDYIVTSVGGVIPYVKAGTVRALGTLASDRAEQLPDVPTTVELGFKDLIYLNWFGFFAPVGVPQNIHNQLEQVLQKALHSPKIEAQLHDNGLYGVLNAAQFKQAVDREFSVWSVLMERLNIKD
jgi:tripartite-type tricarboxylate transporter receptor subunit TctC